MSTTKFQAVIDKAERDALTKVDVSKSILAAAGEMLPETEGELEDASDKLHEIETSFGKLSDEFTAADHAEAVSSLRRAELRYEGAKRALSAAEKGLRSSDRGIAVIVANIVSAALPGVVVISTFAKVLEKPRPAELPLALVTQTGATTATPDGRVSGQVEVTFHRSAIHRPLDIRAIEATADRLGVQVEALAGVRSNAAGTEDKLSVRVIGAHLELPIIPTVQDRDISRIGSLFAAGLADAVRAHGSPIRFANRAYISSHLAALPDKAVISSETYGDDGTRTLVVESSVLIRVDQLRSGGRTLAGELALLVDDFSESTFVPGLGVISSMVLTRESGLLLDPRKVAEKLSEVNENATPRKASDLEYGNHEQVIVVTTLTSSRRVPESVAA